MGPTVRLTLWLCCVLSFSAWSGRARAGAPPAPSWATQASTSPPPMPSYARSSSRNRPANSVEVNSLYAVSALYGLNLGLWVDIEFGIGDPGVRLIPPMVLGVGTPVAAYLANQPRMKRGVPSAIAAGAAVGALEGAFIAGAQMARSDGSWGGRAFSRSVTLGSTLGAAGGAAFGVLQQPSPNINAFAASGATWGALIGGLSGLSLADDHRPRHYDNPLAGGALIGINAGLLATMGLSTLFVPTVNQLRWMWIGSGLGAALSLPAFLFYTPESAPPARRGFLVTGTAVALGVVAGGVFGPEMGGSARGPDWAQVASIAPLMVPGGLGLQLAGTLE